jgi:hypothetical protein
MFMKRREFLKTSATVSAITAAVGTASIGALAADQSTAGRDYYELRAYRLKEGGRNDLLDSYLEKAAIPALNRSGAKPIGVFVEQGANEGEKPKDGDKLWMLITYPSLEAFSMATARVATDPDYLKSGAEYLALPKDKPGFERIDSWFLLAFFGLPKLDLPAYSRERKSRIFELRTYESHSEAKALKKIEMFDSAEIGVMREVGLAPVFYGQALIGRDLPHLTYMLSAENRDEHKKHWRGFGGHATWKKLNNDPQYADTVSKITSRFLAPTSYSQI